MTNKPFLNLLAISLALVACAKDQKKDTDVSAATAKSPQEIITGQSWCLAKKEASVDNASEIARLRLSGQNTLEIDTILQSDGESGLEIYPSIESSEGYKWMIKSNDQKYYSVGVVVELTGFDPKSASWTAVNSLPEGQRPKSAPTHQLNLRTESILGGDEASNTAYPCSAFSAEIANSPINRDKNELKIKKTLSLTPYLRYGLDRRLNPPKKLKYPLTALAPTAAEVADKYWCRSEFPYNRVRTHGTAKALVLRADGSLSQRRIEGYYDEEQRTSIMRSYEIGFSLQDGWLIKDGQVELKREILNKEAEKSYADWEALVGPKVANFYTDANGTTILAFSTKKWRTVSDDEIYFDCAAYWREDTTAKGYRFTDLTWTVEDPLDPFKVSTRKQY